MNRRSFCLTPLLVALPMLALGEPFGPASAVPAGYRYVGPYVDFGCLDINLYVAADNRSYGFLCYHRWDDGQCYRGPFPGFEWDEVTEGMDWFRDFYSDELRKLLLRH